MCLISGLSVIGTIEMVLICVQLTLNRRSLHWHLYGQKALIGLAMKLIRRTRMIICLIKFDLSIIPSSRFVSQFPSSFRRGRQLTCITFLRLCLCLYLNDFMNRGSRLSMLDSNLSCIVPATSASSRPQTHTSIYITRISCNSKSVATQDSISTLKLPHSVQLNAELNSCEVTDEWFNNDRFASWLFVAAVLSKTLLPTFSTCKSPLPRVNLKNVLRRRKEKIRGRSLFPISELPLSRSFLTASAPVSLADYDWWWNLTLASRSG